MLTQFGRELAEIAEGLLSGFAGATTRHCRARPGNPSTKKGFLRSKMDARVKPAHDGLRN